MCYVKKEGTKGCLRVRLSFEGFDTKYEIFIC